MDYDSEHLFCFFNLLVTDSSPIEWRSFLFLFFVVLVCITLSFIVSGAEVAFFSLNNQNLKQLEKDYRGKKILYLLSKPKELLGALIIANTFINLFIILLINGQLEKYFIGVLHNHLHVEVVKFLIEVFIILLFSEVLPKNLASQQNMRFALFALPVVGATYKLFFKLSKHLNKISNFIEKKISHYEKTIQTQNDSIEELKYAIEILTDKEEKKDEITLIKSIMDFQKKRVKQIMKPRIDVKAIDYNASFAMVKKHILEAQYSRFPVYKKNLDNMMGVLNSKHVLSYIKEKTNFRWQDIISQPVYVLENQTLENCLKQMREKKVHMAIVIDEFGSTQGIVSFEDIVEEVVGEISDEFDITENKIKVVNKTTYLIDAKISIQDFANYFEIPISVFENIRKESDTLAGLLLELWENIPKEKSSKEWKNLKFTIIKLKNNRIQQIKVKVLSTMMRGVIEPTRVVDVE